MRLRTKRAKWETIEPTADLQPVTTVSIDYYASWKLFSKSLRPRDLVDKIKIEGNQELGKKAVEMVSFMA